MPQGETNGDTTALASRVAPRGKPTMVREDQRADALLRDFHAALETARRVADQDAEAAGEMEKLAWRLVGEADPVRLSYVQRRLLLSAPTARAWTRAGLFEDFGGRPQRVGLESVARVGLHLPAIRQAGRNRDLMAAVLSALEFEALKQDDRFHLAVEQMRHGERTK